MIALNLFLNNAQIIVKIKENVILPQEIVNAMLVLLELTVQLESVLEDVDKEAVTPRVKIL